MQTNRALRLGRFIGTGPELWLNLQKTYELDKARLEISDLDSVARFDKSA